MKIVHRVSVSDEAYRRETLASLNVCFNTPKSPLVPMLWFEIDESHAAWEQVRQLIHEWDAGDIVHTTFTSKERDNARFLKISTTWHFGYPQPEDDIGYVSTTYDATDRCQSCGIGNNQVAPFRMKGEPRWGKKHFLQLNWVFDEYFVLPHVWEAVFRPLGIGCSEVLDHRTGSPLKNVVQLTIKNVASLPLIMTDRPSTLCSIRGRRKYSPIRRGFFPAFQSDPAIQICRTNEFFGSGASAWNAIIVAANVYRTIKSHKLSGIVFEPLQDAAAL